MMNIKININSNQIAHFSVHNTGEKSTDDYGREMTKYSIYRNEDLKNPLCDDPEVLGTVWHHRPDGASDLTALAMSEINEEELEYV